jgi:aspartate racemase
VRRIGLIGGTTWVSSLDYYRILNQLVAERLGPPHSASLVLHSLDFATVLEREREGTRLALEELLLDAARELQAAGAELLAVASNTGHKYVPALERWGGLPVVHIADGVRDALQRDRAGRVGLIGTSTTLGEPFLIDRLRAGGGIDITVPDRAVWARLDALILDELGQQRLTDAGRALLIDTVESLRRSGAEAVVGACTELTFGFTQVTPSVPVYDTTRIHCEAIVRASLADRAGSGEGVEGR